MGFSLQCKFVPLGSIPARFLLAVLWPVTSSLFLPIASLLQVVPNSLGFSQVFPPQGRAFQLPLLPGEFTAHQTVRVAPD